MHERWQMRRNEKERIMADSILKIFYGGQKKIATQLSGYFFIEQTEFKKVSLSN